MKVKSETFVVLKKFKSLVEILKDLNINTLCLNQVGKYMFKEFVEFFQQHNIARQLTTINTPHQHVVKEHKNKTILDKAIEHVIE
jgi:fructose-1-phosphate kinase PfkB-like protein